MSDKDIFRIEVENKIVDIIERISELEQKLIDIGKYLGFEKYENINGLGNLKTTIESFELYEKEIAELRESLKAHSKWQKEGTKITEMEINELKEQLFSMSGDPEIIKHHAEEIPKIREVLRELINQLIGTMNLDIKYLLKKLEGTDGEASGAKEHKSEHTVPLRRHPEVNELDQPDSRPSESPTEEYIRHTNEWIKKEQEDSKHWKSSEPMAGKKCLTCEVYDPEQYASECADMYNGIKPLRCEKEPSDNIDGINYHYKNSNDKNVQELVILDQLLKKHFSSCVIVEREDLEWLTEQAGKVVIYGQESAKLINIKEKYLREDDSNE